jgi:hypothetical protein
MWALHKTFHVCAQPNNSCKTPHSHFWLFITYGIRGTGKALLVVGGVKMGGWAGGWVGGSFVGLNEVQVPCLVLDG